MHCNFCKRIAKPGQWLTSVPQISPKVIRSYHLESCKFPQVILYCVLHFYKVTENETFEMINMLCQQILMAEWAVLLWGINIHEETNLCNRIQWPFEFTTE